MKVNERQTWCANLTADLIHPHIKFKANVHGLGESPFKCIPSFGYNRTEISRPRGLQTFSASVEL